MGNIFAGSEIVEIGIQIEKNGRDFYNVLVGKSKSDKAKEIFKFLAQEEEKHILIFQGILEKTEKYEPPESYPGEYFAYMNSLASEYVFTKKDKGKEIAERTKSDGEAADLGIGFEKDSIIFYGGMKRVVPEYEHKLVDELIMQEQNHLRKLVDLKANL
jgi:rubrerythrin